MSIAKKSRINSPARTSAKLAIKSRSAGKQHTVKPKGPVSKTKDIQLNIVVDPTLNSSPKVPQKVEEGLAFARKFRFGKTS